jgi:cyclopropane fatty-acyl-phospholipid synthase-like methyltransferase
MNNLYKSPLITIIKRLKNQLKRTNPKDIIAFKALNPDITTSLYNGNTIRVNNEDIIYRGYKSWLDLAQILQCRMLTPQPIDENFVMIRFEKLNPDSSFHKKITDKEEKYGQNSIFSEIHKNEETSFVHFYMQALENVKIETRMRILNLGVNAADEFETIKAVSTNFANQELVGIDYCVSAVNAAKEKFKNSPNISFYTQDINNLNELDLGTFDLIISIGTLQSSNLEFNRLLMSIVQNQLKRSGAVILGFPNCRWVDGEMLYGAKVKNYPFSEMGLLYKDVIFSKKYLQQKKFRVTITGKDYIFLTATSILKV